jgi:hypothetical protein
MSVRFMGKLDKVYDKLQNIDVTLAAQHETLKDHIRRTEILEVKLEPVEKHVNMVNGAIKFIGLVGIIIGIWEGLRHLL